MGLDTSHGAWRGSYSAFNRWRDYLAKLAGYKFKKVYLGGYEQESIDLEWGQYDEKNFDGDWETDPKDPLIYLICHSDCEGHLEPEHSKLLAERLTELLGKIPEGAYLGGHVGHVAEKTQKFIDGLLRAYKNKERLEFH